MRHLLVIYLILLFNHSFSQTLPRIKIEYNHGGYPFGAPGLYHTSELFNFNCDNKGKFRLIDYTLIKKNLKQDSVSCDELTTTTKLNQRISSKAVYKLLSELNRNDTTITLKKLKAKSILCKLNFNDIMSITNLNDSDLFPSEDEYSWIEKLIEKHEIKKQIKSTSNFTEFINAKLNNLKHDVNEGVTTIIVDYYDDLKIELIDSTDTIIYKAQLINFMGQPFENQTKSKKCNYCVNWDNNVINPSINIALIKLLPDESQLKKAIQIRYYLREYFLKYI